MAENAPEEDGDGAVPGPAVISQVNAGVEFIEDLVEDDERDGLVEQINLHSNSIRSMDGLEAFTRLVELCLSSNCIEEIDFHALQPLVHLRVLDLTANSISSTLGFPQLPRLEELSMAHNSLDRLEGLTRPVKFPKLRYLDLRGNDIVSLGDMSPLQRLKRLVHLRLQAADGSQANPICDLDNYQHGIIQMLPKLELLDEEDVEFLKEVGSLHMPKYRLLVRRIAEKGHSRQQSNRSPRDRHGTSAPSAVPPSARENAVVHRTLPNQRPKSAGDRPVRRQSPLRPPIRVVMESEERIGYEYARPDAFQTAEQTRQAHGHSASCASRENGINAIHVGATRESEDTREQQKQCLHERIVVKESATNTEVDVEKDILRREKAMAQKEAELLDRERVFLAKEHEYFGKEKVLKAQVVELQGEIEAAMARAAKAEAAVLEMSGHLLQKERDQAAAVAASDTSAEALKQSQSAQQDEWDATLTALKSVHRQEIEQHVGEKRILKEKVEALEADASVVAIKLREAEGALERKTVALDKSEAAVAELTRELKAVREAKDAVAAQLSGEVQRYKERTEQAERQAVQLEKQVAELKVNVEAVYNKCIEKEEAVQQLKKSMTDRQEDIEALRAQHAKDAERQDRLQQQQQDLYEKQLQASVAQVEVEFRKEFNKSGQKFQLLQRKHQETLKEMKRVRETYKQSLRREASARAEVEKLQAILADDKKKLFVDDAKRSDAYKSEIKAAKERCAQLEQQLAEERNKNKQLSVVSGEAKEQRADNERLRGEVEALQKDHETWTKKEDDLRAALKVKDVMLADQLRQIRELQTDRQKLETQFNDEMADFQAQIEDLEVALDESLQKNVDEEVKSEELTAKLADREKNALEKEKQLESLRAELEQKASALEFLDQEMQRMRTVLDDQDELFQKRLQKHLDQKSEELEQTRVAAEEAREHQRVEWQTERSEMVRNYQTLGTKLEAMAAQNAKLRTAVEQERKKNMQNDRDMRTLLAQIDRERQAKKDSLRQIKSLFEQLQKDAP